MGLARELTVKEKLLCEHLGVIVMFWNHVEDTFRSLVGDAAEGSAKDKIGLRLEVLVANLGNVSLAEALTAIADDYDDALQSHLKHCASLFDALRVYRNYYVHCPTTFHSTPDMTVGYMKQKSAKGGALRLHQGSLTHEQLEEFIELLSVLLKYEGGLIRELRKRKGRTPLASLEKPPLPDRLELKRLRLIERKRPPQS